MNCAVVVDVGVVGVEVVLFLGKRACVNDRRGATQQNAPVHNNTNVDNESVIVLDLCLRRRRRRCCICC